VLVHILGMEFQVIEAQLVDVEDRLTRGWGSEEIRARWESARFDMRLVLATRAVIIKTTQRVELLHHRLDHCMRRFSAHAQLLPFPDHLLADHEKEWDKQCMKMEQQCVAEVVLSGVKAKSKPCDLEVKVLELQALVEAQNKMLDSHLADRLKALSTTPTDHMSTMTSHSLPASETLPSLVWEAYMAIVPPAWRKVDEKSQHRWEELNKRQKLELLQVASRFHAVPLDEVLRQVNRFIRDDPVIWLRTGIQLDFMPELKLLTSVCAQPLPPLPRPLDLKTLTLAHLPPRV